MEPKQKYDVFISYRREGGDKYARTIQQALEKQYRVFLDFDELKDGVFDQRIIEAISNSPVFLLILSKGALDRCVNEKDWVRQEILQAVKCGCHIVPVTIDDTFDGIPDSLPEELRNAVGQHQFSELQMKTLFKASMEQLVRDRIAPYLHREDASSGIEVHIDVDADCDMFRFNTFVQHLKAGEDNVIHMNPGKYKLEFISTQLSDIKKSMIYSFAPEISCDFIEMALKDEVDAEMRRRKAEEEAKIRTEEEAKRKAEEAKRKAEEAKIRTEEENKQIIENQTKNSTSSKTSNLQPQITTQNTIFTDPGVQNHLGDDFYYGENEQKQSYSEAVKWYRKAAKQGHSQAQFNLGRCYESGKGVQQNDEEAAKWYRKAAEQGHEEAQCDLGLCYEEGRGVAQDYVEAVKWYQRAAKQGNDYAQLFLASCYKEGTGVAQDYEEAVKWYRKAIEQGNVCAQCDLGLCYEEGTGVAQDYKEATKWYLKSAEQGYDNAQFHLALCYEKGRGVSRNYMKAKEWCNKAAQQGHEDAIEWLENMKKMGY